MSNTVIFLLCHGAAETSLFAIGFMLAILPVSVSIGFTMALIKLIKELRENR